MENTEIKEYDAEKYKEAVWISKQNITLYKARVSGPEYIEKGVNRIIDNIAIDYNIDEITFNVGDDDGDMLVNSFITWEVEGQHSQKSKVHFAQVDDEYEITIAINNVKSQATPKPIHQDGEADNIDWPNPKHKY